MEHEKDGGSGSLPKTKRRDKLNAYFDILRALMLTVALKNALSALKISKRALNLSALKTKRPKFFKVLMQDASLNLRIPRMFHVHLPSRLPEMATLLCPHTMSWAVQIYQSGPDIYFQKGWPEFVKAHDLHTGYFLAFQYNGNMNFEVEVFDTTCCLKCYPHKHCTTLVPAIIEIEDSSDSENMFNHESDGETDGAAKSDSKETNSSVCEVQKVSNQQNNFQREQIEGTSCRRPIYIKIEDSSGSEDIKNCKQSREFPIDSVPKRRKLSNSNDKEKELFPKDPRVIQIEAQRKKTIKSAHDSTNSSQFEKILTPSMIRSNMINIPKAFCRKNDLITNRTIFLKRKIEGKGVLPNEWQVGLFFGPTESRIRNGWKKFCKENNMKIGERCIFRLISKDTILVRTVLQNDIKVKGGSNDSNFNIHKEDPHLNFESQLPNLKRNVFATIPKMLSKKNRRSGMRNTIYEKGEEISILVRQYHLTCKYMPIPFGFCQTNDLMSKREMALSDSEGKEWHLIFNLNGSKEGRFSGAGWRKFINENGLRAGDKCLFKIVTEELVLVQVVKSKNEE